MLSGAGVARAGRRFRLAAIVAAFALIASACGDETATTTTTTVPDTSTTSTSRVIVTTSSTTTLPPPGPPIANVGDKNKTVEAVQFLLNCNGYGPMTVDGSFGPTTEAAISAAQTSAGLTVTGLPDQEIFALWSRNCSEERPLSGEGDTAVANAAVDDPERFPISLPFGSKINVDVNPAAGLSLFVEGPDGLPLGSEDGINFEIGATDEYVIVVVATGDPVTFTIDVDVEEGAKTGDWVLGTKGIAYKGTMLTLGDAADDVIDKIFEYFGHGVRGGYGEFDTGWDDPDQPGFRGILIEGTAFLFYGPNAQNPGRPETLGRVRYFGPSFDADGNPRPPGYVATAEGITVGNTLADLKTAYGSGVVAGSNAEEHYYKHSASGGVLCFYFGADAPTDASKILEINTECRT
jgi:peptidoglycan hydrolase-like protein with peptidoglycan-binding domain